MTILNDLTFRAVFDFVSAAFLLGGVIFMFVGALGVVRLPDAYHRIHAASICVTLGLSAMLIAACFHLGAASILMKSLITIVFIFVATPIGSHMLAKAAHDTNLDQWDHTLSDEFAEDKAKYGWMDNEPDAEDDDSTEQGVADPSGQAKSADTANGQFAA